jgi:predicted transcriptional regulator
VALPEVRPEPVRRTVSIKLTEGIIERLREYTHKSRHQKQDVVEVALQRFLDAEGF